MAETVIELKGVTRARVVAAVRVLPRTATGKTAAARAERTRMLVAVGVAVLSNVHKAYVRKMRLGTDAAGRRWKHLAKSTIKRRKKSKNKGPLFGERHVLYESGLLERSLRPPARAAGSLAPSLPPHQVLRPGRNSVTVGTTHRWAGVHHREDRSRLPFLPQRRLWPAMARWPRAWRQAILTKVSAGVVKVLLSLLGVKS